MITIISFDEYTKQCREELIENGFNEEVEISCDSCDGSGSTECCECGQDRDCTDCDGRGTWDGPVSEYVPRRAEYYRKIYQDVVKYCGAIPGGLLDNIAAAFSELNRSFGRSWRDEMAKDDSDFFKYSRHLEARQ